MRRNHFVLFAGLTAGIGSASAVEFDSTVPPAVLTRVTQDLDWVRSIAGSSATPLHQRIFGLLDGSGYEAYLGARMSRIGMNPCAGGSSIACVVPRLGLDRLWLTEHYARIDRPQVARVMVIFHEIKHVEATHRYWPHVRCPRPFRDAQGRTMKDIFTNQPLAGTEACDVTAFGSYGSSTILLKNIQKFCTNCSSKVRQDAGLYADDQLGRITDAAAKRAMVSDFRAVRE